MPGKLNNVARPGRTDPGLYIHIPFCIRKCPYCDFYSSVEVNRIHDVVLAVTTEMAMHQKAISTLDALPDTLYFGGGTPSLLSADQVEHILNAAIRYYGLVSRAEITLEANPGTLSREKLAAFNIAGINRLNIGVQSFCDDALSFLGRIHSARQAKEAIGFAKEAGFHNIGIDLIYGLPGQTRKKWRDDLECALQHGPEHLSCYMLSYEPGTPLHSLVQKGSIIPQPEERVADLFLFTIDFLSSRGYRQYEISNFFKAHPAKDYRSRHNRKYWNFTPYLGFGPSAHSFVPWKRWWNGADVKDYIEKVSSGLSSFAKMEIIDREKRMAETLYLGLRRTDGIQSDEWDGIAGMRLKPLFEERISVFQSEGWMKEMKKDGGRIALTPEGMLRLDAVVGELIALVIDSSQ